MLPYVAPRRALSAIPPSQASAPIPEDGIASPDSEHTGPLRKEERPRPSSFNNSGVWPFGTGRNSSITRSGSGWL